jgi:hypothetical protein
MKTNLAKKFFTAVATHAHAEAQHKDVMAKGWGDDTEQHASCKNSAESWKALAQTCAECAKADTGDLGKLLGMDDGDRLVPTSVSVVAIPRHGAPQIRKGEVAEQFRKLIQVDENEE